jgi:predicted ATPase
MLKRIYIDNFRCFVNFELVLDQQQLILGVNGTGKSTLLDALRAVKALITGDGQADVLFPYSSRTRWQSLPQQTFELELELDASYRFRLELDSWGRPEKTRIKREVVFCQEQPVFEFVEGEVHLFNNQFQQKVTYPFDWFRSALATVQPRPENARLMEFKKWIKTLHCLELNPHNMSKLTEREEPEPAPDMSNFVSWYRHVSQEQGGAASKLQTNLSQVLQGLESLDLKEAGAGSRILAANFSFPSSVNALAGYPVAFDELSDGQRVLIALYALLNFAVSGNACLFLDEPENYVAIPEIQPWLMELRDRIEDSGGQVILISHHPEMINYLAPEIGLLFERVGPGPVRVRKYKSQLSSMPPSEEIARGWSIDE